MGQAKIGFFVILVFTVNLVTQEKTKKEKHLRMQKFYKRRWVEKG